MESLIPRLVRRMSLTAYFVFVSSMPSFAQWGTSGTNIYNSNSGNVGVGTSSPIFKLDVRGGAYFNPSLRLATGGADFIIQEDPDTPGWIRFRPYLGNGFMFSDDGDSPNLTIAEGGNVGVGTLTPSAKLDVIGNIHTSGIVRVLGDIIQFGEARGFDYDQAANAIYYNDYNNGRVVKIGDIGGNAWFRETWA
jgi:hypothetical protein